MASDWHDINSPGGFGKEGPSDDEEFLRLAATYSTSEKAAEWEAEDNARLAASSPSGGFQIHSLSWRHTEESRKGETKAREGDTIRLLCGVDGCNDGATVTFELFWKHATKGQVSLGTVSTKLKDGTAAADFALDFSKVTEKDFTIYFTPSAQGKYGKNCDIPLAPRVAVKEAYIAYFFDGTDKDEDKDRPRGCDSNIAKLHELYNEDTDPESGVYVHRAYYLTGVGAKEKWLPDLQGLILGVGGEERIAKAVDELAKFGHTHSNAKSIYVDVFGYSRGAALARHFVNRIRRDGIRDSQATPTKKMTPPTYIDGDNRTFEISVYPKIENITVRFVGLFDTVGSFGVPGDDVNLGYQLNVHTDSAKRIVHYTARHEYRSMFDLVSIKRLAKDHEKYKSYRMNQFMDIKPLPPNMVEREFAGSHADVGGGYMPGDEGKENKLALVPLYAMLEEAKKAGVPFVDPDDWRNTEGERERRFFAAFELPDELRPLLNSCASQQQYNALTKEGTGFHQMLKLGYMHDSRDDSGSIPGDKDSTTRDIFYHGVY